MSELERIVQLFHVFGFLCRLRHIGFVQNGADPNALVVETSPAVLVHLRLAHIGPVVALSDFLIDFHSEMLPFLSLAVELCSDRVDWRHACLHVFNYNQISRTLISNLERLDFQ